MKVETLHSPHGRETEPPYVCPRCHHSFQALFIYLRHIREAHQERKGLSR